MGMTYYILLKNEPKENVYFEQNQLGYVTDKLFYVGTGFYNLQKISEKSPHLLDEVQILNEQGKIISIKRFLNKISNLKFISN